MTSARYELSLGTTLGSELPQHAGSDVMLAKAGVRQSRRQRPASASRLQQRLPPVAVGHNQPGSYLLYSLNQVPPETLQYTSQGEMSAVVPTPASRLSAVAGTTVQRFEALGLGQSLGREVSADTLAQDESACPQKKRRPASAGIRRAESRQQSPEGSRYQPLAVLARLFVSRHKQVVPDLLQLSGLSRLNPKPYGGLSELQSLCFCTKRGKFTIEKARIQCIVASLYTLQAFLTESVTEILHASLRIVSVWVFDNGDSVVKDRLFSSTKTGLMEVPLAMFGPFGLASKRASSARLQQVLQQSI